MYALRLCPKLTKHKLRYLLKYLKLILNYKKYVYGYIRVSFSFTKTFIYP